MAADSIVKKPLITGQFVWSISKKDGKLKIIVGPDPLEATDDDIFVIPDGANPKKMIPVSHPNEAIQDFVTLKTGEYAVVYSPSESSSPEYPNGNYVAGKNEMKPMRHGQKRVITIGHFPIWPGQSVEIRKLHQLSSSQYLMVVVENVEIDQGAPYYEVTMKCADIRKAVVDETVGSEDSEKINVAEVTGSEEPKEEKEDTKPGKAEEAPAENVPIKLRVGQRIIIPGSITPTYIPPTGIEIVVDDPEIIVADEQLSPLTLITKRVKAGTLKIENISDVFARTGNLSDFNRLRAEYEKNLRSYSKEDAIMRAMENCFDDDDLERIAGVLRQETRNVSAVREAVVLGPTEFCVLFDEDGRPKNHKGPGRVFPGPYDRFRTEGSRNRIYDAYHIRGDRGLLLRVVAESISAKELCKQLPYGSNDHLKEENYVKGDEIFIGGFDAYLVPSNSIEVINPETRKPHIGNEQADVYVQAIGVDQKSGVYVADVNTGNVKLVKGEKKLLLDPRKEKHINRKIPGRLWNLMITQGEPHKMTKQEFVDTPWAMSVVIPNNEAMMVTSKDGRRVVVGPRMEILEFEEWPEVLTLSRGRPKNEDSVLETCYLRVKGNRITDQVIVETADFVKISIDVSYGVEFFGSTQEEKSKWFNYKNYTWLLATNLRSRLKLAARGETLADLYPVIPEFVRGVILGEKQEGDKHRPGLKFDENNMIVNEVDVLSISIPDSEIAKALSEANRKFATIQIEDTLKRTELESAKNTDAVETEMAQIEIKRAKRKKEVAVVVAGQEHDTNKARETLKATLNELIQKNAANLAIITEEDNGRKAEIVRTRTEADKRSAMLLEDERRENIITFREALAQIQVDLVDAAARADGNRLEAIQPRLVEAIEGLGNKELAKALAENLPRAGGALGFLLGQGGLTALKGMVKGTVFEAGINALTSTEDDVAKEAEGVQKTGEENKAD